MGYRSWVMDDGQWNQRTDDRRQMTDGTRLRPEGFRLRQRLRCDKPPRQGAAVEGSN
jgi:hypothetical protein